MNIPPRPTVCVTTKQFLQLRKDYLLDTEFIFDQGRHVASFTLWNDKRLLLVEHPQQSTLSQHL